MKTIAIGRSSQCDIIVSHECVSRVHARISVVGGQYVYEDVSKHGSVVEGQFLRGKKVVVVPGTEILLAGRVPLPWKQVYAQIPLKGRNISDSETSYKSIDDYREDYVSRQPIMRQQENISVGWGVLAFLIPFAGWIMYFSWKDETPHRASQANVIAWIGFIINLLAIFSTY